MSPKKRRSIQHIMEDSSVSILREKLPAEWVVHEYKPDYGIDYVIELFKYIDQSQQIAETLGENFYVQLKSVQNGDINKVTVFPRFNVERFPLKSDHAENFQIPVLKFRIDVSQLITVQAMGAAVPVLLFLVTLDTNRLFFICLNDLIDKVIIPENPDYHLQQTQTILIPTLNEITDNPISLDPLRFFAKRPKFYAAFSKFLYQKHELENRFDLCILRHFLRVIARYDFWETTEAWAIIKEIYGQLKELERMIDTGEMEIKIWDKANSFYRQLSILNNMYEEICREWYLPTYLATLVELASAKQK